MTQAEQRAARQSKKVGRSSKLLFEVQYEEAKAIAQELAQFRNVPAANPVRSGGAPKGNTNAKKTTSDDHPQLIDPAHYVKAMRR